MEISIIELFILVGMVLLAFSIAANAKGKLATTVSWAVAVIMITILAMTVIMSKDKISNPFKKNTDTEEVSSISSDTEDSKISKKGEQKASPKSLKKSYRSESAQVSLSSLQGLLTKSLKCANAIENFSFGDIASMSNDDYQAMQQKASKLRYDSENLSKELILLRLDSELEYTRADFTDGMRDLKVAAARLNAYFTSKNITEETTNLTEMKTYSNSAAKKIRAVQNQL